MSKVLSSVQTHSITDDVWPLFVLLEKHFKSKDKEKLFKRAILTQTKRANMSLGNWLNATTPFVLYNTLHFSFVFVLNVCLNDLTNIILPFVEVVFFFLKFFELNFFIAVVRSHGLLLKHPLSQSCYIMFIGLVVIKEGQLI